MRGDLCAVCVDLGSHIILRLSDIAVHYPLLIGVVSAAQPESELILIVRVALLRLRSLDLAVILTERDGINRHKVLLRKDRFRLLLYLLLALIRAVRRYRSVLRAADRLKQLLVVNGKSVSPYNVGELRRVGQQGGENLTRARVVELRRIGLCLRRLAAAAEHSARQQQRRAERREDRCPRALALP